MQFLAMELVAIVASWILGLICRVQEPTPSPEAGGDSANIFFFFFFFSFFGKYQDKKQFFKSGALFFG